MDKLLPSIIFYLIIGVYVICTYMHGGFKITSSNFESLKYYIWTSVFFFVNINVLFFCAYCKHCHGVCIPFIMSAVLIGSVVYLTHLGKLTVSAIKNIFNGEEFELMAPFFSIPYFYLINDIVYATINLAIESLHAYENKMLIVLLYPFFVAIRELTKRIKELKSDSEVKPKE